MTGGGVVPAGDRLAVVDLPAEERQGLILPPGVGGRPDVGIVVAVGDDVRLSVESGDKVFYRCKPAEIEDIKIIDAGCVLAYDTSGRHF